MLKTHLPFTIDPDAKFGQTLREQTVFQEPKGEPWFLKSLLRLALVVGVGVGAYTATPAHANGSMGIDVKIIRVSPSVSFFGDTKEGRKLKADVARDNNRHRNDMNKMEREYELKRMLEADRAYYKKLSDQRKKK